MGKTIKAATNVITTNPLSFGADALKGLGVIKSNPFSDIKKGVRNVLGVGDKEGSNNSSGPAGKSLEESINDQVKASREAALGLITDLQKQSRGESPSLADAQLRQAGNRALAQQLAAAASQRGGNPAALQRALVMQQGQQSRDLAEQSSVAKLQERQAAQQQLGNLTLGQQQQDLSTVLSPAQLAQQVQLSREQAQLQKDLMLRQQQTQILGSLLGGAASLGSAGITKSDEKSKKNIKSAKNDIKDFLDKLSSKSYNYKEPESPGAASGKRVGILAQDLEKSGVGRTMVMDTPHGKMVDTTQGFGAILAAQAELNKRLNALEKKK